MNVMFSLHFKAVLLTMLPMSAALVGSKQSMQCINHPLIPLNANFVIRGFFTATLKCKSRKEDLTLQVSEQHRVLICDPHDPHNFDFQTIRLPECVPLRLPTFVELKVQVQFLINVDCPATFLKSEIKNIFRSKFYPTSDDCRVGADACIRTFSFFCGNNVNEDGNMYNRQLDAYMNVMAPYRESKGYEFYLNETKHFRQRVGIICDGDNCDIAAKLPQKVFDEWYLSGTNFLDIKVHSWSGNCDDHPNSVATNLELDKAITCRGCPQSYKFKMNECLPCDYGTYTELFSNKCEPCPSNSEKWRKLCFNRGS